MYAYDSVVYAPLFVAEKLALELRLSEVTKKNPMVVLADLNDGALQGLHAELLAFAKSLEDNDDINMWLREAQRVAKELVARAQAEQAAAEAAHRANIRRHAAQATRHSRLVDWVLAKIAE